MSNEPRPLATLEHETSPKSKSKVVHNVAFSSLALMSDGYNAQVISAALLVLGRLHPEKLTKSMKTHISQAYFIGIIVGALLFGFLIDRFNRKAGVVFATLLMLIGTVMCTAASGVSVEGQLWMLAISRGILGSGAGGEYPTCSSSATEASDENDQVRKRRGFLVAMCGDFAIDFGIVMGGVLPLIVLAAYGYTSNTSIDDLKGLNTAWRVFLILGAIVPLSLFYFRWKVVTSTAFQKNKMSHNGFTLRIYWLIAKRYWKQLTGASLAWFLYDFVAYPSGLLTTPIIDGLSGSKDSLIYAIGYGALVNAFLLPGCVVGGFLLDKIGRKRTQILGFVVQAVLGYILGGALGPIQSSLPAFIVMYGLFVSSAEAGPGVATILISAEVAPTAIRGHFVGLAAAFGKAGAAIGTSAFGALQERYSSELEGQKMVFYVASTFSVVGAIITWLLIPEMSRKLEKEDEDFRLWLKEQGVEMPCQNDSFEVIDTTDNIKAEKASA
ncbi:MFS general substrate transporter [Meira miltonrushii]|uniref:MFS general substrate transporter n=1 Tax=Meira miltonrushii TaxID=1280837 RepID=A0A316V1X4_9BASI|nr:MFS general substrate transporter [Meira miltonrushii]PWN31549.1 MFS general substrate transporter [Meira miltonrushii]